MLTTVAVTLLVLVVAAGTLAEIAVQWAGRRAVAAQAMALLTPDDLGLPDSGWGCLHCAEQASRLAEETEAYLAAVCRQDDGDLP